MYPLPKTLSSGVILDSQEERFGASTRTLRYGFVAHDRKNLVARGRNYAAMEAPYRRDEVVDLVAHPPLSARAGTRLGRVVASVDGQEVGQTPLVAKRAYEKPSLGQRLWYTVWGIFE